MSTQTAPSTQSSLAALRPQQDKIDQMPSVSVGLTSLQGFELVQRAAKCLAASSLVPKDYQGNVPNCVVALNMAARVGADPLMVMQNLVVVHGRPTWSSQFLIATVNSCGRFSALRYEFFGKQGEDTWGCRAWAIELATGEKLIGTDVTIALAKAEGWYGKNGSKWKTMPQQMLMYRSGSWWTRAYAPELSMGLHTADERQDFIDATPQGDGTFAVNLEELRTEQNAPENPIIDATTGEITDRDATKNPPTDTVPPETHQPVKIPAKALPTDATQTDWEGWALEWQRQVELMTDEQSLTKLQKINESVLGNMKTINPPKYNWCIEQMTLRSIALGNAGKVAA